MKEELDPNIEHLSEEEIVFEQVLRPKQFGDFFVQWQCFWSNQNPIPVLLQSVRRQVRLVISKILTPSFLV